MESKKELVSSKTARDTLWEQEEKGNYSVQALTSEYKERLYTDRGQQLADTQVRGTKYST